MNRRIGIDVGGTNTDAVLVDVKNVIGAVKTPTTEDITSGVRQALADLIEACGPAAFEVNAVMIGTTHFVNAVVQRRGLNKIASLRLTLPGSASLLPLVDWPTDLATLVDGGNYGIAGGHEYDGQPVVPLDEDAIVAAAHAIRQSGVTSIGITGSFSPLNPGFEERAAEIIRQEYPEARITCSHNLGRIGLLERENATLLNAALLDLANETADAFRSALDNSGIKAPLFITHNDGTVTSADSARRYPVHSFASGPTNSMRGAAFLSGGQSDDEATTNLDAINRSSLDKPWQLSFSYGRGLQALPLAAWGGDPANVGAAQAALLHRARMTATARQGAYSPEMEKELATACCEA